MKSPEEIAGIFRSAVTLHLQGELVGPIVQDLEDMDELAAFSGIGVAYTGNLVRILARRFGATSEQMWAIIREWEEVSGIYGG